MEERITQVEMKISFMEDTIITLNTLVVQQQKEIDGLYAMFERLETRLTEGEENSTDVPSQRPPHY
jgi:SlyX protein